MEVYKILCVEVFSREFNMVYSWMLNLFVQELLEFWLTVQHQREPEPDKFLDSINKVVVLTQDVRQITIFLEVMVTMVSFHCSF